MQQESRKQERLTTNTSTGLQWLKENHATTSITWLPNLDLSRLSTQTKLYKGAQNENLVTDDMVCDPDISPDYSRHIELEDHDITWTTPHVDTPALECGGTDMHWDLRSGHNLQSHQTPQSWGRRKRGSVP
jgi:hypothetical protein